MIRTIAFTFLALTLPAVLYSQSSSLSRSGFESFLRRTTDSWLHGTTSLMHAAESNDTETVKELIANGHDVDECNKYGWTALMLAASRGSEASIDLLLDAGAEPNIVSRRITGNTQAPTPPSTALAEALKYNHRKIAMSLLDHGATPDALALATIALKWSKSSSARIAKTIPTVEQIYSGLFALLA